ncbi:GNAT family N-acetyltransferase [Streptomyces sp. VB1]|uniref:GNAT family N-acetyltransferase n=1 Tax=Streptomyces sp. VB1 TaxID=2986803 RepID=UPI002241A1DD|nr:GNAT family N-acetyltransferase [Streptomyces sp. VB1]UZI26674.1 GNAT family N-acetyltransferase [Streptomyces sp. VB1]
MVALRALCLDGAAALTRVYSGASIRHTTGKPLTLDQAHEKIRAALARAAETPRAQWSWGILTAHEMIGLISLRRRTPTMGTIRRALFGCQG